MPKPLSIEEFEKLLTDENTSDSEILEYIEIDEENSDAFQPVFKPKEGMIVDSFGIESAFVLNVFNKRERNKRHKKYWQKIASGYSGIKIVSEGDSWFQFPLLLEDVIDHLSEDYAVFSLGAAGDWLKDIVIQDEFIHAIRTEGPSVFLISGGGNDLVGNKRIKQWLHSYSKERESGNYLNNNFELFINEIEKKYRGLFRKLNKEFPDLKVVCHGYDYVIPNNGRWFGKPMNSIGIKDKALQKVIAKNIMDRFNDLLDSISHNFNNVNYVDCRGVVDERWNDELHPTDEGFKDIAEKIKQAI